MNTITATELKSNLGKYLNLVQGKEEVYITKNGKKIARLAPIYSSAEEYFMVKEEADYYGTLTVGYEEFLEISENSEHRLEYLDGEIYQMTSPSVTHQKIAGEIFFILKTRLKGSSCEAFIAPFDVHFKKTDVKTPDVLQPDVLVACDVDEKTNEKDRYMGVPTLVVEVLSPSTKSRDAVRKLNTYMLSGVDEYWIVDPKNKQILVYNFSEFDMDTVKQYEDGMIFSKRFDIEIPFNDIFKDC